MLLFNVESSLAMCWQKDDIQMHEVMRLAHMFLQSFCLGNQANQTILHQSLDLFLTPGVHTSLSVITKRYTP